MVDKNVIIAKADTVHRHLNRVREKRKTDLQMFLTDIDRQESVLFNLQMAIQNCIDMASHIISQQEMGVPGSYNETFYLLEENGYIDTQTAENMVKAVGFRNLMVHAYSKIDTKQVFEIANHGIEDLENFVRSLFTKLKISAP